MIIPVTEAKLGVAGYCINKASTSFNLLSNFSFSKYESKQMPKDYTFVKIVAKDFAGFFGIFTQLLQAIEEPYLALTSITASPTNQVDNINI
jgi:hypothetical protein